MRANAWLINRDFARLWYGQAVSALGDMVFDTTLLLWVKDVITRDRPWSAAAVSGVPLAAGAAILLVGPIAGVFVDRWNRRATMLRTEVVRAILVGALTAVAFLPTSALPTPAWLALLYVVAFAVMAANMFFLPARFAVLGDVVPDPADRARAAGIGQATVATAAIIGPPLAAPLLYTVGLQWALLLNAVSYVVSYLAIRSVRLSAASTTAASTEKTRWRDEFAAGLRFFAGSRILVAILVIAVICACGTGAVNALDVFFVTDNLHTDVALYGLLSTGFGAGAVVGALSAGRVVARLGARTTSWVTVLLGGILLTLYSRQTHFWTALVVLAVTAIPVAILNASLTPLLLGATPPEYLGRMMAVFNPVNQLASMVSIATGGWLASTVLQGFRADLAGMTFTRIDTIFTVSGLLIVIAGIYGYVALPRTTGTPTSAEEATLAT